jgi:aromatic-L-amino-acid decarboxylase
VTRFVFRTFGINGLRQHVRRGILLCEEITLLLSQQPDLFEVVTQPRFGVVTFRIKPGGDIANDNPVEYDRTSNETTRRVCAELNASGSFYVTGCEIGHLFVIRLVTTHNGNNIESIKSLVAAVVTIAREETTAN